MRFRRRQEPRGARENFDPDMRVHVGVFTRHTIHTAPAVHVGFRYLRVGPPRRSSGKKKLELIEVCKVLLFLVRQRAGERGPCDQRGRRRRRLGASVRVCCSGSGRLCLALERGARGRGRAVVRPLLVLRMRRRRRGS